MKFLSDILAKAGLTVDGVVTLNNTATGQTPAANDNSTKLATTAWVRGFVTPYSLPIASGVTLGGIKIGSGLAIDGTGIVSVAASGVGAIRALQQITATAGQTVFTVSGGYTPGLIDVFLNGVLLTPTAITSTNGTTFTLGDGALVNDLLDIFVYNPIYNGFISTTDQVPEGATNLYYTNARARAAISLTTTGTSGAATYNSSTGVLNIPSYIGGVVSIFGRTGTVVAVSGDYTTTLVTEGNNLYYTDARARASISVTGSGSYNSATGVITVTGGVTSVNTLTGAVVLTTTNIAEGTNLYYTDARVLAYLTANSYATQTYVGTQIANLVASAPATLDTLNELAAALGNDPSFATTVSTSIGTKVPQTRTITINGTTFDLSADRSFTIASGVTSFNTRTGAIIPVSGDYTTALVTESGNLYYTDTRARLALSFVAGSGGYNSTTGVITIPTNNNQITNGANYITLVSLSSSATGLTYTNTTGVFSLTAGYSIPTTASQTTWDSAYTNRITSLTTTGTSGAATLSGNVLNIPQYQGGVTSFNTRTGAITLTSSDVTTALTYTPVTNARTLTINGDAYDLTADRTWTIGVSPSARTIQTYTATASQTTFTVTGGYVVGLVDVFINGVRLTSADFTATNGTTVVLTAGTGVNNIVDVIKYTSAFTASSALRQVTYFTATAGQTSFTVSYTPGLVDVYYNGSKLSSSEYTASNGTSVVIANAAVVNDSIEVISYAYSVGAFSGQVQLNGTGLVRMSGTTVSYDNATYATQSYVTTAVANLVNAAPSTLDTLNELATALGNDANFATTVTTSIATKQPQLNGTGFVKISGTTISYDNSTYYLSSNPSAFIALTALSFVAGSGAYNSTTGVITIPTNNNQITNGAGYTTNVGTVTSVAALTIGTSGTDLSSSVATGTTTPVITLNVPTASAANRGALSSTDWTTFNNKQATISVTTTGTSGAATLSGTTINIPNYGSALSGYLPLTGGTLTGALNGTSASFSGNVNALTYKGSTYEFYVINNAASSNLLHHDGTNLYSLGNIYVGGNGFSTGNILATQSYVSGGYLPLTGGTLTGALTGTSATFSGSSTLLTLSSGAGTKAVFATTRNFGVNRNFQISVDEYQEGQFAITPSTTLGGSGYTTPIFTLGSTGAATFSSSVTAGTDGVYGNNRTGNNAGATVLNIMGSSSSSTSSQLNLTQVWNGVQYPIVLKNIYNPVGGSASSIFTLSTTQWNGSTALSTERFRVDGNDGVITIGDTLGYTTAQKGQFFSKGGGGMFTANLLSGGFGRHFTMQRNDSTKWHIGVDGSDNFGIMDSADSFIMTLTGGGVMTANTFKSNVTPGSPTLDSSGSFVTLANGAYVDFPAMSGMIIVNNTGTGAVQVFICGGGITASLGAVVNVTGTMTHSPGVGGYRFTNNTGSSWAFAFQVFKTRGTA